MEKVFASITWSLNLVAGITTHTRARSVLSHLHRRSGLLGTCICRWYSEMPKRNGCCRQAMPNEHFLSDKGRHRQQGGKCYTTIPGDRIKNVESLRNTPNKPWAVNYVNGSGSEHKRKKILAFNNFEKCINFL
ncbi:uncharacterized protein LOC124128861 isoform X2 [Haliotis rufescens]|uniref:uncharacterized protein LOC124128861 isoform X2 n=1 Tax=Haliotis rufescens TaxID=6454 RepID=UPI00201F9AA0|nr:uncharacterized protein LOC124128861 isoform X2 [Haliotis rufescens]